MQVRLQRAADRVDHRARYLAHSVVTAPGMEVRLFERFEQPLRRERNLYAGVVALCQSILLLRWRNAFRVGDTKQDLRGIPVITSRVLEQAQHKTHVERIVLSGKKRRFPDALEAERRSLAVGSQIEIRGGRVFGCMQGE